MRPLLVALVACGLATLTVRDAGAEGGFQEIPLPPPPHASHLWAYAALAGGAALVGTSFALSNRANTTYDEYLAATDPAAIEHLYERTTTYDHYASATLLTGEGLIAAGLYLRFLRGPHGRAHLVVGAHACALSLRY